MAKTTDRTKLAIALADAIVERLWMKGLLTDEERDRLYERNSLGILQK